MRSVHGARLAVPDWLAGAMRPKKAPVPWPDMIRAVFAIWVPLAAGYITGRRELVILPALGGLLGVLIDNGGPYWARVRRIGAAAVFGGAGGLVVGSLIHGRGWLAVIALVVVAGVSAILARLGGTGSATGLQLLTYSALGLGSIGALRPWWHTALEFAAGAAWALALITPSWLLSPRGAEQRAVAAVYHSFAAFLRAIGTPAVATVRGQVTNALNAAYDMLLTGRSYASGRNRAAMHLVAVLNVSHQMAEAALSLRAAGERPPPWVTDTIERLADAIAHGRGGPAGRGTGRGRGAARAGAGLPLIPPQWSQGPGALALRDSMVSLARAISGNSAPPSAPPAPTDWRSRVRGRAAYLRDQLAGGRIAWTFTIRLIVCTGVAAVLTQVLTVQRSYWVVLTVAVILKPDYGSVFTRAVQRGAGTVAGAVLGAATLAVVPFGLWLLVPFGVFAALLPYGKSRNFGLSAMFLTPLVVLLIDLQVSSGWRLAVDRLVDTLLGCAIVLLIGYAPWPSSWQAHLPGQFAATLKTVSAYMQEALVTAWAPGAPGTLGTLGALGAPAADAGRPERRSQLRRKVGRSLSDLRAEFQRTMSEPAPVSRRATAWWPAEVGLEEVMDAVTATAVAISRGAPAPAPDSVRQLSAALRGAADAIQAGAVPTRGDLPADPEPQPVTAAVRSVLAVLGGGEPRPAAAQT
ncbi:FUSC family protein [Trebonia sp.]|uniref:FUSC family protein n=1 Tax=Trebonia sp. TaxID=2767075 RepID=UPI00261F0F19|nr:FUSC family protein [Trebonia sp.]